VTVAARMHDARQIRPESTLGYGFQGTAINRGPLQDRHSWTKPSTHRALRRLIQVEKRANWHS
jgi:hypothetical protein